MQLGKALLIATLLVSGLNLWAADKSVPDSPGTVKQQAEHVLPAADVVATSFDMAEFKPAMPAPLLIAPVERPKKRVLDAKFLLLIGAGTALTVADYEMTQHCLHAGTCVETDPILPHSRAGMYGTNIPLNLGLYWWSYRRKAQGKRLWWVAPLAILGSHAVGVGSNLRIH